MRSKKLLSYQNVSYVDWIVANGWYRAFKSYCTAHPAIKSRNRLARGFLVSLGLLDDYITCQSFKVKTTKEIVDIAKKNWLER